MDKKFSDYEISSGTLKGDDIASAIRDFALVEDIPPLVDLCDKYLDVFSVDEYDAELPFRMDDIWTEMDCLAEEGYYFGSLEGDGACFGFWKDDFPW